MQVLISVEEKLESTGDAARKSFIEMSPLLAFFMEMSEAVLSSLVGAKGGVLGLENRRALEMLESRGLIAVDTAGE